MWDTGEIVRAGAGGNRQRLRGSLRAAVAGVAVIEAAAAPSTTPTAAGTAGGTGAAAAAGAAGVVAAGRRIVRRLVDAVWSGGQVVLSPAEAPRASMQSRVGGAGVFGAQIFNDVERLTAVGT